MEGKTAAHVGRTASQTYVSNTCKSTTKRCKSFAATRAEAGRREIKGSWTQLQVQSLEITWNQYAPPLPHFDSNHIAKLRPFRRFVFLSPSCIFASRFGHRRMEFHSKLAGTPKCCTLDGWSAFPETPTTSQSLRARSDLKPIRPDVTYTAAIHDLEKST
jgi:hypothetical protein